MTPKQITRAVLYSIQAVSIVFLAGTKGLDAASFKALDWFQLLTLSLALNAAWIGSVISYLDNSSANEKTSPNL